MCVRVRVCLSVCMIFPVGHVSERVELYMLICAVHREKEKEREGSEIWMRAYTSQRWLIELLCASSSCSLVWSCVEHFVCGCSILLLYVMLSAVVFIRYQCHHRPVSEWQQFAAVSRFELWPWRRRTLNLATFPSTRCTFLCTCFILKFVFFRWAVVVTGTVRRRRRPARISYPFVIYDWGDLVDLGDLVDWGDLVFSNPFHKNNSHYLRHVFQLASYPTLKTLRSCSVSLYYLPTVLLFSYFKLA